MSARLDGVGCAERQTLPIPFGHHVYVVSDLALSPTSDEDEPSASTSLVDLLGDIDDAAVVVVAGNLFRPDRNVGPREIHRRHAGTRCPRCATRSWPSPSNERHRFIVLPGSVDHELSTQPVRAQPFRSARRHRCQRPHLAGRHGRRRARPRGRRRSQQRRRRTSRLG